MGIDQQQYAFGCLGFLAKLVLIEKRYRLLVDIRNSTLKKYRLEMDVLICQQSIVELLDVLFFGSTEEVARILKEVVSPSWSNRTSGQTTGK